MDIITLLSRTNNDIYSDLFFSLPISDKRSFIRTCNVMNRMEKYLPQFEQSFQKMINDTSYFSDRYYYGHYHPLYKYTMELLFDGRSIPDRYIIVDNRVLHQFPKVYKRLGEKGDVGLLRKLLKLNRNGFLENNAEWAMAGAAKVGNISILKWMTNRGYLLCEMVVAHAIKGNQIRTLKWLIRNGCKICTMAVPYAAKYGYMDILKFLLFKVGCPIQDATSFAASAGQLPVVKFLYSVDPNDMFGVCESAARSGHLEILQFAYEKGHKITDEFTCSDINILHWLLNNDRIKRDVNVCKRIAWSGNLECLQYLYHNGYPILNKDVFVKAVRSQNIEMIRWLRMLGCPFDRTATKAAVGIGIPGAKIKGSLTILKLLVEWGCELDCEVCSLAAYHGNLELLQYLYECGCKLDEIVLQRAATNGHLHIIIWARRQGCPWCALVCQYAVWWHHLDVLKWLRGIDREKYETSPVETEICPWDEHVCLDAIRYRHIDILKFAIENGCPFDESAYQTALETEDAEIINYMSKHHFMTE